MSEGACDICTRPARDEAYVCDPCGDGFARDLRDIAEWLADELDTSMSGAKGVRYRHGRLRGTGQGDLAVNWQIGDLQRRLWRALYRATRHCQRVQTRHTSPYALTELTGPRSFASWLGWRVDGLCLDPEGPRLMESITRIVASARRAVDRPPDHQYLGQCEECDAGRVYAIAGQEWATCDLCRHGYVAEERRTRLLSELDDRLVTAAEIAHLSTYLGLHAGREQVRKRVNLWHHRGRITAHASITGEITFRFGDVWGLLMASDTPGFGAVTQVTL